MADQSLQETGMYRDVMAQPECWARLLKSDPTSWQEALHDTRAGLFVGMGSSHYAALAAQFALERSGGIWNCATSDEARHYLPPRLLYDTVVAISQSGESADTVAACEQVLAEGSEILSITNTPGSRLARMSHLSLALDCGEEMGSSTKTYTTTVLALLRLAGLDGVVWENLPNRADKILTDLRGRDLGAPLAGERRHYFLGAGPNSATALEAALISKEKLFLHAEGSGAPDFVHGPLEALDENCTVWLFSVENRLQDLLLPLARRVRQTGARLAVIGEGVEAYTAAGIDLEWSYSIPIDGVDEVGALLFILPVQLLVLQEADRRGYPIDTFRRMGKVMSGYDYGLHGDG